MSEFAVTAVLSPEALTPEECASLRAAAVSDPALAATLRALDAAEADVRRHLDADGGEDRCLIVLLALDTAGRGDLLDAADRVRLERARPVLTRLVAAVPCLSTVLTRIAAEAADFETAWETAPAAPTAPLSRREDRAARPMTRPPVRRLARAAWRTVAVTAVALFVVAGGLVVQRDRAYITLASARPDVVRLPSGTVIHTSAGARLVYPDPDKKTVLSRHVRLTGDAYFDVEPTGEVFRVETPTATVSVLGTVFGVRSGADRTEVTLVEGSVAVQAFAGGAVRLAPGEQTVVAAGAAPSTPGPVDVPAALDWSGFDVFRDTPLEVALARLGARSGLSLRADARLAGQRVTGTFEASRPLADVLDALAVPLGARVERTADGYVLR